MYKAEQSDEPTDDKGKSRASTNSRTGDLYATERSAKQIFCDGDPRCTIPTSAQRRSLLVGFAMCGKALPGNAYDAVRVQGDVDLDDAEDIASHQDAITLIEIKSTNRENVGSDLGGYFFNITSAELTLAQALKDQYRFVFVHTLRGDWQELSISDVLGRAKAMYPAFHIRL